MFFRGYININSNNFTLIDFICERHIAELFLLTYNCTETNFWLEIDQKNSDHINQKNSDHINQNFGYLE